MGGRKEPNPIWWDLKAIVEFGFYPKSNGKILMGSWKFLLQSISANQKSVFKRHVRFKE